MTLISPIKPLVLIGPSGSGRAAISFRLTCDLPNKFDRLISSTSRKPRLNEKEKVNFYFRS
jgi:guanylate kinase